MERHWDTASKHEHSAPADEAVLALRQSFCDYLVSARKQRDMSIHGIAGITRIPVRSLERLESGLFEELPADVFVRGFLRSYARCVGLDVEETIRRYTACGMTPAPVASPMADKLASTMATLHEGGHPSVRQVVAPLLGSAMSEDGIGTSPGVQTQPAAHAAARMGRSATDVEIAADTEAELEASRPARSTPVAPSHVSIGKVATGVYVRQQHAQEPASGSAPESAQVSATSLVSPSSSSHDEQPVDGRPARRKRRRRRRQRREVADTASVAPETPGADVESVSSTFDADSDSGASSIPGHGLVDGTAGDCAADACDELSIPAIHVLSAEVPRLRAESMSDTTSQLSRAATAAEPAAMRPFPSLPRASSHPARTQPVGRGRAPTVSARPVLIIDDAHPEEAERAQEERVERSDSSWRSLLPPSLLDSDDGSHRGTLTLAVIILVIVATLTMSYLLRRPNVSGDGVTWNATTALDEHRLG